MPAVTLDWFKYEIFAMRDDAVHESPHSGKHVDQGNVDLNEL